MSAALRNLRRKLAKALTLARTPRFRRGLRAGVGAGIEHEALLRGMDVRTVVDVGANKGQFALLALELFPQARVHAFEPLTEPFARLSAWSGGETRLIRRRLALAEAAETRMMHVSAQADSSSLRAITGRQVAQFPGTHEVGLEEVAAERLDLVLSPADLVPPALLKIDVQGGELDVLRGATDLLACFTWIYVECSFIEFYEGQALADDVVAFLAAAGFEATVCWRPCRDANGRPVQADILFARNNGKQKSPGDCSAARFA
jgi:FkbM family methyltransferase